MLPITERFKLFCNQTPVQATIAIENNLRKNKRQAAVEREFKSRHVESLVKTEKPIREKEVNQFVYSQAEMLKSYKVEEADKETIRNHIWEHNLPGIGKKNERAFNRLFQDLVPGGDSKGIQRAGQRKAIETAVCNSRADRRNIEYMIRTDDKKLVAKRLRGLIDVYFQRDNGGNESEEEDEVQDSAADCLKAQGISLCGPSP